MTTCPTISGLGDSESISRYAWARIYLCVSPIEGRYVCSKQVLCIKVQVQAKWYVLCYA